MCIANPQFRHRRLRKRRGLYLVRKRHEFRLTPWYNDPVSDASGEALYLRDEETGRFWSPTPLPARGPMPYVARHGFGYSIFEYAEDGITTELTVYVAIDAPVKFCVSRSQPLGTAPRLSVTGFWEWVLGELRHKTLMHVVTEVDPKTGALFARNSYNRNSPTASLFSTAATRRALSPATAPSSSAATARPPSPAAHDARRLSGASAPGSIRARDAGAFRAGRRAGARGRLHPRRRAATRTTRARSSSASAGRRRREQPWKRVWDFWNRTLGAVYVETPDPVGQLSGQRLAALSDARLPPLGAQRLLPIGRRLRLPRPIAGCDGAWSTPSRRCSREHLCGAAPAVPGRRRAALVAPARRPRRAHPFLRRLPLAPLRHLPLRRRTGDTGVLDEQIPFIEGRPVKPDEEVYYDLPQRSDESATLYEHCVRAIKHGLRFGAHGLPLMGCGDWNDGMNLVGEHGKGESVWLAFFLYDVLTQFAESPQAQATCLRRTLPVEAISCERNIEQHAWDGQWYRRAYFDDGEPLGSATNPECQIDSLPQSWAILSGAGDRERSRTAMEAVDQRLVRRDTG